MRRLLLILTVLILVALPSFILAAKGGGKGPSDQAYQSANENASFKKGGVSNKNKKATKDMKKDQDKGGKKAQKDKKSSGEKKSMVEKVEIIQELSK